MASYQSAHILYTANPSLDRKGNFKIVAAFDFGTTYSGYAWSLKSQKDEIYLNKLWGAEFAAQVSKTPTAVLVDDSKNFVAFGYQARRIYSGRNGNLHMYDRNFKMQLYTAEKLDDTVEVTSSDGKQNIPLLSLITMSIRYMYTHFLGELKGSYHGLNESLVRVVLTVPAIWPDHAKDFMRKAACEAGIESDRLMLALEPEAASLYCRTLQPTQLRSDKAIDVNLPNGTRYIVIDCGGGTVDLSVHEVVDIVSVKEIHCANGGPWGGAKVNQEFEEMFEDLLGKTFIKKYAKNHPVDWFELNTNFELIKRTYKLGDESNINLPNSLIKGYENKGFRKDIGRHIKKRQNEGYEYKEGRLFLSPEVVGNLFKSTINSIASHVSNLWQNSEVTSAKYAFMVGGFSECSLLFKHILDTIARLDSSVQVLRPTNADIAVLKGAVKFGHDPNTIKSRISRLTYGAGVMIPFDPVIHAQHKKYETDGEVYCTDVFNIWAKKNEPIEVGEERCFSIYPHSTSCTSYYVSIYSVDRENVTYTTEPGVKTLANLEIPIPDNYLPKLLREVKHYVYFGGTELHVRIQDVARPDGASQEAKMSFDCGHATQL